MLNPQPARLVISSALLMFASLQNAAGAETSAAAAQDDAASLQALVSQKMTAINAQQRELFEKMEALEQQRRELELLMSRVDNLDEIRGGSAHVVSQVEGPEASPEIAGTEQMAEKEATQQGIPDLPRISDDVGGVLTPKGRLVLEPSARFIHSTVNRVSVEGLTILPALLVGVIDVVESDRDTVIASLTTRYGVTNRFEIELQAPYVWRDDTTTTRKFLEEATADSSRGSSGSGLGDMELGMRYQFNHADASWPFVVGNLRIKSTTGTDPFELATQSALSGDPQISRDLATGSGFWSVNPSLTFISPSDPVVFFGNLGYLWTFADDKGIYTDTVNGETTTRGFGEVDPGDAWRFNFGMGLGLNEKSSFSLSYSLDLFNKTNIETASIQDIPGSDVTIGRLLIGYSLQLRGGVPFNLAIGIGTTDDAPDTDINFRLPFNLFK